MLSISFYTPGELAKLMGERMTQLRLAQNWKRETLAERAGVSPATLKRFETSGRISLDNLLRLALALGCLDQFEDLLAPSAPTSILELDRQAARKPRRRGSQ